MTREELIHSAIAELQYQNEIDELYHHGIRGMKWGVRRYQNEDGSLTPAGEKHYAKADKAYEKDKAKYGFNDARGSIKKRYRDFYTKNKMTRGINDIYTLGGYSKKVRESLGKGQDLEVSKINSVYNPGNVVKAVAVGLGVASAAKLGYKAITDPAFQARAGAHFREWTNKRTAAGAAFEGVAKGTGYAYGKAKSFVDDFVERQARKKATKDFVKTTGYTKYDIAGYLPGATSNRSSNKSRLDKGFAKYNRKAKNVMDAVDNLNNIAKKFKQ